MPAPSTPNEPNGEEDRTEEPEGSDDDSPPVTRGQAFVRMLVVTFVLFAILEIGARVVLHFKLKAAAAAAAADYPPDAYLPDFGAKVDYRFINLYTANPARAKSAAYDFDSFGFRLDSRKLRFDGPSPFKKIWMVGGSTVQGLGALGDETIPAHLNKLLEEHHSQYRVVNMGQAAFTSTQELLLLVETLQAGHRPDAILSYDGATEVPFPGTLDEVGSSPWEKRSFKTSLLGDIQGGESAGTLLPLTLLRLTKMDDLMKSFAQPPQNLPYAADNWDVVARRYFTTLGMIKALAEEQGVPSWFFFQPILAYEDHYRLRTLAADEERFRLRMAPDEYKRCEAIAAPAVSALRERLGARFFDIHDVFKGRDGEKLYCDPRHPNGAGNALIAARIYEEVAKLEAPAK